MNQTTAPDSEAAEIPASSVATGQRLREVRESLGLTRDNVAQELRLNEKLISALEEGDRSKLPPATFISGYLRAYARLLGLPADQLISEYLQERVETSLYRTTDRSGMPALSSRDPKFRYTTFIVIAALFLLFAAWWGSQNSLTQIQSGASEEEQHEIEAKLPEPMPLYQEQDSSAAQSAGAAQQETASSQIAPGASEGAPANVQTTVTTAAPAAAAPPEAPPAVNETPKLPQPAPVVIAEPLSPSTPQSLLVMEYQAASWTQVQDADGRVLAYEVVNPGRTLELRGVAPFKVFLGYSPGVLVYYNGNLFPHADYQRGDLARFRVGARADNRPLSE